VVFCKQQKAVISRRNDVFFMVLIRLVVLRQFLWTQSPTEFLTELKEFFRATL
jgi:hypothetical protein